MKHISAYIWVFVLMCVSILIPKEAQAAEFYTNEKEVILEESKHIQGSLFAAGPSVIIDGVIDGDLYCLAQHVTITGEVTGDVLCAAQTIINTGYVGGDIRVAAQTVRSEGIVDKNATVLGQLVQMTGESDIAGELVFAAMTARLDGSLGSVVGFADSLTLSGHIAGAVETTVESLHIESTASIAGPLSYSSPKEADVSVRAEVGELHWMKRESLNDSKPVVKKDDSAITWWPLRKYKITSLFVYLGLGILMVMFFPRFTGRVSSTMQSSPFTSMAIGFFGMLAIPIVVLALVLTLIGIPLVFLFIPLVCIALLVTRLQVSYIVGQVFLRSLKMNVSGNPLWEMGVGVALTWMVFGLPFIGLFLTFLGTLWGFGAVLVVVLQKKDVGSSKKPQRIKP